MVPHPVVVDFAVALLATSFLCDLLAVASGERELAVVAWWTLLFGTVAAAFAVLSGFVAALDAGSGEPVASTVARHRNLALVALGCFAACLGWRLAGGGSLPRRRRWLYWSLASAGLAALVVSAHYGGILVFRLGVGVGPRP